MEGLATEVVSTIIDHVEQEENISSNMSNNGSNNNKSTASTKISRLQKMVTKLKKQQKIMIIVLTLIILFAIELAIKLLTNWLGEAMCSKILSHCCLEEESQHDWKYYPIVCYNKLLILMSLPKNKMTIEKYTYVVHYSFQSFVFWKNSRN